MLRGHDGNEARFLSMAPPLTVINAILNGEITSIGAVAIATGIDAERVRQILAGSTPASVVEAAELSALYARYTIAIRRANAEALKRRISPSSSEKRYHP